MQIKILKTTVADGKVCAAGTVQDLADNTGRFLINTGRAEAYEAPAKPRAKKAPENKMVDVDELETR